jgi:hypothetical protein
LKATAELPQVNGGATAPPAEFFHETPSKICSSPMLVPQLEHQIINPAAGLAIPLRWLAVIRGGRNPFELELTSSCADRFGLLVPIPTCALQKVVSKKRILTTNVTSLIITIHSSEDKRYT